MRIFFVVVMAGFLALLLVGYLYVQPMQRLAPGSCGGGLCTRTIPLSAPVGDPGGHSGGGG